MRIGILHPGEMGAALGAALVGAGHDVAWASAGRSRATAERAAAAGLHDAHRVEALAERSELLVSICPPSAAEATAASVGTYSGLYLDANAIAPATTLAVGRRLLEGGARFVDGGVIGPPPERPGTTRLYLAGPDALEVSEAWATPLVEVLVISEWPGAASALKAAYGTWTKGTAALVLTLLEAARAEGIEDWLRFEWAQSQPELAERAASAARSAEAKGWRWAGEMDQDAMFLAAHGLPDGAAAAAAAWYARYGRPG